jgi:ABC-type antimicrobial peptide transport system permease subunit
VIVQSAGGLETVPIAIPDPFLLWTTSGLAVAAAAIIAMATTVWGGGVRAGSLVGALAIARRSNTWAVGCEVFLSMLLFTTAAAGVIAFERVLHEPSGFAAETVVTASLGFLGTEGRPGNPVPKILETIAESPGIQAAAAANVAPFSGGSARTAFSVRLQDGSIRTAEGLWPEEVSLQYFRASGTRIQRGRDFRPGDLAGIPACLISISAAKALSGPADLLAETVYNGGGKASQTAYCRVIGVVEDAHLRSMAQAPEHVVYRLTDEPMPNLIVRSASPGVAIRAIRNAVRTIAPMSLASSVEPLNVRIDEDLRLTRLLTMCAALSAGVTGVIMAVGVFGILAIEVAARRRDMGIRIALGAGSREIAKALLQRFSKGLALSVGLGSAWGAFIVFWLLEKRWISAPLGAAALLAGLGLLGLVLLAAAFAPLRRALDISPIECLRSE